MMDRPSKLNEISHEALQWALEESHDSAIAAADWLARDLDPDARTAVDLLSHPQVPLATLRRAKEVYKTMRILGETAADRQMGARLYLASVAAALVRHGERISRQSDAALTRSLRRTVGEDAVPVAIRELARAALRILEEGPTDDPLDRLNEPD